MNTAGKYKVLNTHLPMTINEYSFLIFFDFVFLRVFSCFFQKEINQNKKKIQTKVDPHLAADGGGGGQSSDFLD